ncbi:hypothetical protein OS493_009045 [Desmophyllum pertusum]|uniref:Uncharacterized protein n=1 Tax=Desmophyllum pertusum TaxID=174260 RepID=A0A9X0CZX1_9CNID|nr:hypothetical protein OS493_009045 [Desmophyllum pertusum]
MGKDKQGISRGKCSLCDGAKFESSGVRCDYCGHTPIDHNPLDLVPKRPKIDDSLPVNNVIGEIQLLPDELRTSQSSKKNEIVESEASNQLQTTTYVGASKKAEMEVLHPDANNAVAIVKSFQKRVDAMTSEKEGVVQRFEIRRKNEQIVAFCNANFIKKHMASQTHKTNVKIAHCRDSEIPLAIQNIQKEVEEQFPQVFIPKTKLVVCRICSTELLLLHKVVLNNVKQHVNSSNSAAPRIRNTTKHCPECGEFNPIAKQKFHTCYHVFSRKKTDWEKIKSKGKTSTTHTREMLEYRANILHAHHGWDVLVFYYNKNQRGSSLHKYGTPGVALKFVGKNKKADREFQKQCQDLLRNLLKDAVAAPR